MKGIHFKRKHLGAFFSLILGCSVVAPVFATAASATWVPDGPGFIEICKAFTPPPAGVVVNTSAPFTFTITHGTAPNAVVDATVTVNAGTCSNAISVPLGSETITETSAPWYTVTGITELPGQTYLTGSNPAAGTATVLVSPGGNIDTVTYTNALVTGYLEICKSAATGSGLTGSFTFNVSGQDGFASSVTVPVGNCSTPIQLPAGTAAVTEAGTNLYVTSITATINGTGPSVLATSPAPNLTTGTATVTIKPSLDASTQTDMTYTNNVVALKVCKVFEGTDPNGATTTFPFTFTATGPAGPNTAPGPVSLQAGQCSNPVSYRGGTVVSITEGIVPGTKVEEIKPTGAQSVVPGSSSVTGRTISIVVGTPITAGTTTGGTNEAIVTFDNMPAAPGTLKICKSAGTPAPVTTVNGGIFSFTVAGVPGTTLVPLGSCAIVGGSQTPVLFPFNSTQTITEAGSADNVASAITVVPTFVTEIVGTTATLTSEMVKAGQTLGPNAGDPSSVSVVIGETTLTEVTFTNTDPPSVASGTTVTVANPGGSNAGTTTAATVTVATQVAATSGPKGLTAAQRKAALRVEERALANVKAAIKKANHTLSHTKGAAHKAAAKRLAALKAQERALIQVISILK